MRAPNSPRPLRATSSSLFTLVFSSIVLSIVLLASSASTRSVVSHSEVGDTGHGVIDDKLISKSHETPGIKEHDFLESHGISKRDNIEKDVSKDEKLPLVTEIGTPIQQQDVIGKSSINSEFEGTKRVEESVKNKQDEGIRRFDAIVLNEDALDKNSGVEEKKQVQSSEIGKTVIKGIIVRDAPSDSSVVHVEPELIPGVLELSGVKVQRKRSLGEPKLASESVEAVVGEPSASDENIEVANNAREKIADSAKMRQVPVLIPVGSSHAKLKRVEKTPAAEVPVVQQEEHLTDLPPAKEPSIQVQAQTAETEIGRIIPELTQAHETLVVQAASDESVEKKQEIVVPELKSIIIHEDGLGELVDNLEISKEQVLSARKSLPIAEESEQDEVNEGRVERSEEETKAEQEIPKLEQIKEPVKNEEISKPANEEFYSPSLSSVMHIQESLEDLKAQAISLQREIRDKTFLEKLREQSAVILPGIPTFTEIQLLDSLKAISSLKKSVIIPESSYLSQMDTSNLNENQLQILKSTEALLPKEQRQTFAENIMECIRGFDMFNCLRIFVWPVIANNLPESFTQNLPTLPIEVNVSDLLSGNQNNPKAESFRSVSSSHQQRLITPELVVSSILKDALNANPTKLVDALPSFIDPQNETLTKLLTPGQLEILKMAEKFLPESTRQEYSNRMFSCVRRFEYFSCVKYFAWPMVKQHYSVLPDFPDYQSWYPGVSFYPGYPILPYPNAEGIGELPEVVEADATRTRSPRPETVIVQILENALHQVSGYPLLSYQARQPAAVPVSITPEQMAIFYTAQQFIPVQLRDDYMTKTMACLREYDYATCAKYSTWPTVRQFFPSLPEFPDLSGFIPVFGIPQLPDWSQYFPDIGSWLPGLPGTGGETPTTEKPSEPQPIPEKPPQEVNATIVTNEDQRLSAVMSPIENRIIQILSNIRWFPLIRNAQPIASVTPESLEVLKKLSYNQLRILGLAKNAIPPSVRGDLDSRFVGCLQGGSEFITCTKNVIWPTLQLYVKNMPIFPEDDANPSMQKLSEATFSIPAIKPGVYQPIADTPARSQPAYSENPSEIAGRSPIGGQIVAESEDSPIPVSQLQSSPQILQNIPVNQDPVAPLRQGVSAKSNDPSIPVISVTDTRFTPIFSDHPETVLLKILTTIQASSKYADNSYTIEKPGYIESLNDYLNADEKNVIRISENLLPDEIKSNFRERVKECVTKSNFIVCSRDIVWPSLAQYYQRLPSFPNFYITDPGDRINLADLEATKSVLPGVAPISETNVKTGQHGDAVVTITDTRFVPIFSQHPEAVILSILRNVQATSPNVLAQPGASKPAIRTSEFVATYTDQQGNIITVAENLLPESIREVFTKRMSECVKENSFLACTRDIAWPTIAQFIPRLPNFPNIAALPDFAIGKPQQPALLPPQLEPAKPSLAPGIALPTDNLIPVTPLDIESRIESTLKQISAPSNSVQPKFSYLHPGDPAVASRITERQANVIRLIEGMVPLNVKSIVVGKMIDCTRADDFPNCVKNYGWPVLRQYVPNIPDFPDIGSYFPQIPQEIPQIPQLPDYQLPQLPNFPGIEQLQGFVYPFRTAQDKLGHEGAGSLIEEAKRQRLTPSVDSSSTVDPGSRQSSGISQSVVPELSDQTPGLLSGVPSDRRRKRRNIGEEPPANYQDISLDNMEPNLPPNTTETEFLKILVNITKTNEETTQRPEEYFVEALNSTMKDSLTTEQLAILKIVEDISSQTAKGFMSQVFQCIRSLSFIRCMGIFVWPVITQNVPSLLPNFGLPTLGSLNPFGRSSEGNESFEDIFGMTSKEFEKELLERKENVEEILIGWYRGVVEEKYDNDYGFLRVQGYGDGEIGIRFNDFKRKGRVAKIKDSKNMPSILTIISDIMEDVLDQRESRPEKKEHGKRAKSLYDEDDYNRVSSEHDIHKSAERSNNDDQIITMFLDKIKVNSASETGGSGGSDGNNYLSIEDAYAAFELLFGTRLSERMAEKLHELNKSHYRVLKDEKASDQSKKAYKTLVKKTEERRTFTKAEREQSVENDGIDGSEKKTIRSGLILKLPKIDEEFVSRKITGGLVDLGRKMKMKMSQVVPGITFLVSFVIQMALAHARAAASVAGMMSNMALGSAIMSMIRQSFFGSMNEPKIKHVYDNAAMGPGITWPQHNYHG